jgi:hypothetical protein
MKEVWLHVDHIVALAVIIGGFIALATHGDDKVLGLIGAAVAWCFRSGVSARHPT